MDNALLDFFLPALDGSIHASLQLVFAGVFVAAFLLTPFIVARVAHRERWERNLAQHEDAGGPDATYGSIEDLAAAAATPAERWADVPPSLLLVFGLLGTFIGLGLALTEAAGALGPGNDALSSLTPIMDSLGSKFKTSTWGILAFLGLKVWFMLKPYEERRLVWAAQKIRTWATQDSARQQQRRADEHQQLINAIVEANTALIEEQRHAAQLANNHHTESLAALQQFASKHARAAQEQQGMAKQQLGTLAQILKQSAAAAQHLEAIVVRADGLIEQGTRQAVQAHLQAERLGEMSEHAAASRLAMESFVHSVSDNIATMAGAADGMAAAAASAGTASVELGTAIGDFRTTMASVLGDIQTGLGHTIDGMGTTFADNMKQMSTNLARATTGIEHAISHLSGGVRDTIAMLDAANQESIQRQTLAQAKFASSGEELMASMATMQSFVELMQTKIEAGLTSVASASRQMSQFETRFDRSNAHVASLVDEVKTLVADMKNISAGLHTMESLGSEVRELVHGIQAQQAVQADAGLRHQEQLDISTRVVDQVVLLIGAVADLAKAQRESHQEMLRQHASPTPEPIDAASGSSERPADRAIAVSGAPTS